MNIQSAIHTDTSRKDPFFYGSERWWAWHKVKAYLSADDVPSNKSAGKDHHWRWANKEYVWRVECGGMDDIAYVYYLDGGPDDLPTTPQPRDQVPDREPLLGHILSVLFNVLFGVFVACLPTLVIIACVTAEGSHAQAAGLGYTTFVGLISFMCAGIVQSVARILAV